MRLPPGFKLITLEKVDSTNNEAKRRAEMGAVSGTIVHASEQTHGRGRRGRQWYSPKGNLYFSLILRLPCSATEGLGISFVSATAMCDALAGIVSPMTEVTVKWPNDILINRRKVSGILLESATGLNGTLRWLIVGVGVNVSSFPGETEYPATSLWYEGVIGARPDDVLRAFMHHFKRWFDIWENDGFSSIRTAWLNRATGIGKTIKVRVSGKVFEGEFLDIGDDGSLLVERKTGETISIVTGDVFPSDEI